MNLQERDLKYIWHPCSQMKDYETLPPIVIKRGKGMYLYDVKEKEYMDLISSWWCNLLGHCNEEINDSVKAQIDKLEHVIFANFSHEPAINLVEALSEIVPKGLNKYIFSDNGSAAVECALKVAFQYQLQTGKVKKTRFMCLSEGYHGETIGALSVGTMDLYAKIYKPILLETIQIKAPDCYRCEYGLHREDCTCKCIEHAVESFEKYGEETAAIILEPLLQGSAGMRIYPPLYLDKIRELCDQYGVLLIADEIATGFGRTGKYFAFNNSHVEPDIMCISKGLTGGYMPMSITLTTDKIYNAFYGEYKEHIAFMHSHTYSGNPLACSAANAVLKILKRDKVIEKSEKAAIYLRKKLFQKFEGHENVGEIRSLNLINAIEIVKDKKTKKGFNAEKRVGYEIYKKGLEKGILLRPLGDVIYFNPPLIIEPEQIDVAVEKAYSAFEEVMWQQAK